MRAATQIFATLAVLLTAVVLFTNIQTIQSLRNREVTDFRVIEPTILLPLVGVAAALWLLGRKQSLAGLLVSIAAFALSAIFWLVQQSPGGVG